MKTQIQKVGNTLAVCIPDTLVEEIHIKQGITVEMAIVKNKLVIDFPTEEPLEEQITLEQLLARITEENIHRESDFYTYEQYGQTLQKLKLHLHEHFGKALDRVMVFGSVARGTATDASDIDVMIILNDDLIDVNWHTESDIRSVVYPIELEDDVVFDLKVMGKADLQGIRGHTPFVENVMKEGITV